MRLFSGTEGYVLTQSKVGKMRGLRAAVPGMLSFPKPCLAFTTEGRTASNSDSIYQHHRVNGSDPLVRSPHVNIWRPPSGPSCIEV